VSRPTETKEKEYEGDPRLGSSRSSAIKNDDYGNQINTM